MTDICNKNHSCFLLFRFFSAQHLWVKIVPLLALSLSIATSADAAKCLYISSYHAGYEWNDGIERGMEGVLKGKCELDKFYMDTKRNKSEAFGKKIALQAKSYIETSRPDILIAADDNASRYLIQPYYKMLLCLSYSVALTIRSSHMVTLIQMLRA